MPQPARKSASILLAVMYALAGTAGRSLHYWDANCSGPAGCAGATEVHPLFHSHGPGGPWHAHRVHTSATPQALAFRKAQGAAGPHDCSILGLLAKLQIVGGASWRIDAAELVTTARFDADDRQPAHVRRGDRTRGPPA